MTTRYRVEYALKSHRRDQLIEWIKVSTVTPYLQEEAHWRGPSGGPLCAALAAHRCLPGT
ncbi:hypothetical protein EMGR_006377 [Emarellia grisea]